MPDHELVNIIAITDAAINAEDLDALMTFYAEDATLLSDQDAGSRAKRRSERRSLQSLSTFGTRKSGEPYDTLRRATYGTEFLWTRA